MTPLAESMESAAMTDPEIEKIATGFVLWAIQEWGQSEAERIGSVQAVLDAAHIQATATCWPVFGGIWPKPCAGPDADRAAAWLQEITDTMRRGHFEDEVAHVEAFIRKARGEQPGICLPGRCIAAEAAASPNFSLFSSHERSNLATLSPHCPPGLALLRGLPGEWTEPPDRQPAAPRHLPRGAPLLGALAWALLCWAALGGAAWLLHWLIYN